MTCWSTKLMFHRRSTTALVDILIVTTMIILRLLMPIFILTPLRGILSMVFLMVPLVVITLFVMKQLLRQVLHCLLSQGYVSGGSEWIMDSGCTNHMIRDKELFTKDKLTESSQKYITFGDNNKGKVIGLGKVAISKDKHIDKVMLVQSLGYNLMFISKLCDMGIGVVFCFSLCCVFTG